MAQSSSFDRIAKQYDNSRGGLERGQTAAAIIARHLVPGAVLEVGIGTGAVAAGLREFGHPVVGVDISAEMLREAGDRFPGAVARADAVALPVADGCLPNVVCAHVLHVVSDMGAAISEAARVLRPGGRLVALHGNTVSDPDPVSEAMAALEPLRARPDSPEGVAAAAAAAGLRVVAQSWAGPYETAFSPEDFAKALTGKQYPYLWRVDDATWVRVVEPVIAALRALPDPQRARQQSWRVPLTVLVKG
ncbi:class I SAM-dependent methyltransferase [Saccharothrix coeruleofusca]|uniref:Type 11 methyltransferase n=1 Tax=Saccharothrix coeruleofusca TaxID=33919 RepID=A0A918AL39_9PSEU|nr:methyltransferase domain-containing protein [Saccharothrix coeruleofusca]MBP2336614.1 SAM-dependent methyltransferase [Saccharothrix coeruleofusca]GGP51733.1 type 11 methyltransferase [Saccharothrix coeruleofusca]GGP85066.1 type 11 methyltransferase [Saccharothrix coeruleofusca]